MIDTARLLLRAWRKEDRAPFAALNADPEVMAHFPAVLTAEQSDALADRLGRRLDARGWGVWVVEERATGRFAGFTGLNPVPGGVPVAPLGGPGPAVEIGWRLARWAWGHGYATEAARASIAVAFDAPSGPRLEELVSFTSRSNLRSQAVMRRIGMTPDPASDFEHPRVPAGHPTRPHVVFRLSRPGGR